MRLSLKVEPRTSETCLVDTPQWRRTQMVGWVFACNSCPNAGAKSTLNNKCCHWEFLDNGKQGKMEAAFMTNELSWSVVCGSAALWYALNTLNGTCLLWAFHPSTAWESSAHAVIWHSASANSFCWQGTIIFTEWTQTKFYSSCTEVQGIFIETLFKVRSPMPHTHSDYDLISKELSWL